MENTQPIGFENWDNSDTIIPIKKVVHPLSDKGKVGHFYDEMDESSVKEIKCSLLSYRKTRIKFAKNKLRCCSDNSWDPAPTIAEPCAERCARLDGNRQEVLCPEAMFKENATDEERQARCNINYEFAMIDLDSMSPFLIRFSGQRFKYAKRLLNLLAMRKRAIFSTQFVMGLDELKGADGKKNYVPRFSDYADAPEESQVAFESYTGQKVAQLTDGGTEAPF